MSETVNSIETRRFGSVSFDEKDIIVFDEGIPGFEDRHKWVLVGDEDEPVKWLQSLDDGELALPVTSPFSVDKTYTLEIPGEYAESIDLDSSKPERTGVLVVVTIPMDAPWEATANMVAPIVVNLDTRQARQIVVNDSRYSIWFPVLSDEAKEAMKPKEIRS